MNKTNIPKSEVAIILGVIVGSIVRVIFLSLESPMTHLFSDPKRHWDNALRFFEPGLMNGCDPILYQVYLYLVQFLTGKSEWGVIVATASLSLLMPWCFYRASREFGLNRKTGLFFWLVLTWLPSLMLIYGFFMIETLLLPLIGVSLWMTGRAIRKRTWSSFLIMTALWMLAVLTKAQAIPMALICWTYALSKYQRPYGLLSISLLLVFVMLLPNVFRTKSILGYSAPFGSGYIAQIMHAADTKHGRFNWKGGTWTYSSPSCYIQPLAPLNEWMIERAYSDSIHEVTIDRSKGELGWKLALQGIHRPIKEWLNALGENTILFLFAPSWPDSGDSLFLGKTNYWLRWIWAPILFQVVVGNIALLMERRFNLIPILGSVLIILFLTQNSVTMEGRYRKPVEPILLLNLFWLYAVRPRKDQPRRLSE